MTKRAAHQLIAHGGLTFGHLRHAIRHADRNGPSALNVSCTKAQALDIFTAAIARWPDPWVIDPRNRKEYLIASNVLRECGAALVEEK